jgi:hypothetical protein
MINDLVTINKKKYKVILHKGNYFIFDSFGWLIQVKYDGIYAFCPKKNVVFPCCGDLQVIHCIPKNINIVYL